MQLLNAEFEGRLELLLILIEIDLLEDLVFLLLLQIEELFGEEFPDSGTVGLDVVELLGRGEDVFDVSEVAVALVGVLLVHPLVVLDDLLQNLVEILILHEEGSDELLVFGFQHSLQNLVEVEVQNVVEGKGHVVAENALLDFLSNHQLHFVLPNQMLHEQVNQLDQLDYLCVGHRLFLRVSGREHSRPLVVLQTLAEHVEVDFALVLQKGLEVLVFSLRLHELLQNLLVETAQSVIDWRKESFSESGGDLLQELFLNNLQKVLFRWINSTDYNAGDSVEVLVSP